jgi:hypothetical protein
MRSRVANRLSTSTQTRPPFASITMMTAMIITVATIVPTDTDKTSSVIRVSR